MFHVIEKYRLRTGPYASDESYGNNGAFYFDKDGTRFNIVASDGGDWDHVSVHCNSDGKARTPTWDEMCLIKGLFWDEDDCVIQYHPAKSEYVNLHPYTLHLWRPTAAVLPIPDKRMVG